MTTPEDPDAAARMRANAFIRDGEARISRRWFGSMTRWLDRVRPQVLPPDSGDAVSPQNVAQNAAYWGQLMDSEVLPEVQGLMSRVFRRVAGDQPVTPAFEADYLNAAGNRLRNVPNEVYARVVREIETGIAEGESIPDISSRVRTLLTASGTNLWPNRATTVARTECLPGDTLVDGALATAVYRRPYSGDWVQVVTEAGREISGTPNHPVLTQRGWVGLGHLAETDHLICDSRRVQESGPPADEDVEHRPATIAEIFDATSAVVVTEREATAQPDFHGDGGQGDVDVLRPYGVLSVGCFSPVTQSRIDFVLPPPDLKRVLVDVQRPPFPGGVPVDENAGLGRGACETPSVPDGSEDGLLVALELCGQCGGRFPVHVPLSYLINGEVVSTERAVPRAEKVLPGRGQVTCGPSASHCTEYGVHAEPGLPCHCTTAKAGQVELDRVARVVVTEWSGHVYNLTTLNGYFSVNEGVYTGNTLAAVNAGAYAGAVQDAEDRGDVAPMKVWLATEDTRTRPTHREADKQRTLLTSPFVVGGAQLLFPGDPRGPANEVIACRCAMLPIVLGETIDWTSRQDART